MLEDLIRQIESLPLYSIRIDCPLNLSEPLWHVIVKRQDDWLNHKDDLAYTSIGNSLEEALQDVLNKLAKQEYTKVVRS